MTIHLEKLASRPLETDPFEFVVIEGFVDGDSLDHARADFPEVPGPGSHPPGNLRIRGAFKDLVDTLNGDEFRGAIEAKFNVDLSDRPTMYTVRGFCRARDGKIHTDSQTKIITVLLYMNEDDWPSDGGRLRLLRGGKDLQDFVAEVEPKGGTLIAFKRSDNSWHGHESFEGQRRAIQLNWVTDQSVVDREQGRHGVTSYVKKWLR